MLHNTMTVIPRPRTLFLFCILTAILVPGLVFAQGNLLENAGFDDDFSSWDNPQARTGEWSMLDASSSPLSGSALLSNEAAPSNGGTPTVLSQCIPATGSTEYRWGGQANIPPGQPTDTRADYLVITYPSANCSGNAFQVLATSTFGVDTWTLFGDSFITDSDTGSIEFRIGVFKPNGVSSVATAYFDNPYLYQTEAGANRIIDEKLSGAWYNLDTSGQGIFLDISTEINLFFGGWFTWTSTPGEIDWMTLQGGFDGEVATLLIYRSSGGKFNDPTEVTSVSIGIAEFRFQSCTEAELWYKFDGETEFTVITLVRIGPAFKGCVD